MDDILWWQALILGIIQGFTEYLPISSSGHLTIMSFFFGIDGDKNLPFVVVVHAATVLGTIVVLWDKILNLFQGLFKFQWNEETKYISKILISMIPVAIVGVFFKKHVEIFFGQGLLLVGGMLVVTSILLAYSSYAKPHRKANISFKDALYIGIAQALAVLPGLSRSGATISTGLILGNKRDKIAEFSFLMVVIPILGEVILDLLKGGYSQDQSGISPLSLIIGFIAAFISGVIACKWMLKIVKQKKLIYFAYYCAIAGGFIIFFNLIVI